MSEPDKSRARIESMFDEIAPTYDKLNHLFTLNIDRRWRREIVNYIRDINFKCRNVLDIASGTGDLTLELLKLNPDKIFATDISKNMLEIQRAKISDSRLTLIQSDASNLPFEDNYFDLVTIGFGIRNFEDLDSSLNEINRVLKKEGKLVILEMFKSEGWKNKIFEIYFSKVMPYFGNKISKSEYAYSYLFKSVDCFLSVSDFIKKSMENNFEL